MHGTDSSWSARRKLAVQRWRRGGALITGAFALATIALGFSFFHNANVLKAYTEHNANVLKAYTKETPDSLKYVLTDLFEEMTFYDNRADTATTTRRADGSWDVHLVLKAQKLKGDSVGNTKEVPIADYVDVGVFGARVPGQKLGEPLLVKKVKITRPVTVLDFVVPKEPKKAGIDPYNKLIDRTPEDNVVEVVKR